MDLSKEDFIAKVVRIVLSAESFPTDASDHDKETVGWSAEVAWNTGCTWEDAMWYCTTFEEVNPILDEEIAFARRDKLRAKYADKPRRGDGQTI